MKVAESKAIIVTINAVEASFPETSRVPAIFENCIRDTLEKAVVRLDDGSLFVLTGDITAMWLRDSSCQLHLYTQFAAEDHEISEIIEGVISKQAECILIDPYANAFNKNGDGACWSHDDTEMRPEVWERKFELDSLCYFLQLSWLLWKRAEVTTHFDDKWLRAADLIVNTLRIEQEHENLSNYRFQRKGCAAIDTLTRDGKGPLVKSGIGLIFSAFRPSDDACEYGYNIPENMFAVVCLSYLSEILDAVYGLKEKTAEIACFASEVRLAIQKYGLVHFQANKENRNELVYAYEVDGFGNSKIMDDANVPSLLAMPYFGFCSKEDPDYLRTRRVILSKANPYYYEGKALKGIGSPHTPENYVWDISLAIQGITASDRTEKERMINMMAECDAGTFRMHEGIDVDNADRYTRPWFSWADCMFCELVMDYML